MSLKKIATTLGISVTTVSRALNGYPEVSEKTRALVKATAEAGGYMPNSQARSLVTGKMDAVGIIYPLNHKHLDDPGVLERFTSIAKYLDAANMDLVISTVGQGDDLRAYRRMVGRRRVDAMIVCQTETHDPRIDFLIEQKFPFIAYGRSANPQRYPWFDFDNEMGARMAVERLVGFGHRQIALITAAKDEATGLNFASQRRAGYLAAMKEAQLNTPADFIISDAGDRRGGYLAMNRLMALDVMPTAVVIDTSLAGSGAMQAISNAGLQAGRDISVIVYDAIPTDNLFDTSVTAVIQSTPDAIGKQLAEMVLGLLAGMPHSQLQVLWQPKIQAGESDGPCPDRLH